MGWFAIFLIVFVDQEVGDNRGKKICETNRRSGVRCGQRFLDGFVWESGDYFNGWVDNWGWDGA